MLIDERPSIFSRCACLYSCSFVFSRRLDVEPRPFDDRLVPDELELRAPDEDRLAPDDEDEDEDRFAVDPEDDRFALDPEDARFAVDPEDERFALDPVDRFAPDDEPLAVDVLFRCVEARPRDVVLRDPPLDFERELAPPPRCCRLRPCSCSPPPPEPSLESSSLVNSFLATPAAAVVATPAATPAATFLVSDILSLSSCSFIGTPFGRLHLSPPRARPKRSRYRHAAMALLALPQPYDFALSTTRYRAWGPDLANRWADGALHRVFGGRDVRITPVAAGVEVEPFDPALEPGVRHYLGAPFDLDAFAAFAETEPVLARLAPTLRGLRPPLNPTPYETLVTSITAQQVSLFAAFAVRNRLIEAFGRAVGVAWEFPGEERLARAAPSELLALGFSLRKAEYVVGIARAEVDWSELATLPDDEVKARLVALRGLGEWTADWFLARHLGRPRAWPAGDLGLVKALALYYFDGRRPTIAEARRYGERFAPFENLSAHYLLAGSQSAPAA